MRIKKKDLRKRLPQLPINYPPPAVDQRFDYEAEKSKVENLCKRLAHNEVEVRDAVLAELPRYLREVTAGVVEQRGSGASADMHHLEPIFMKLSLGLFFCLWHSDKPIVQHECAFRIAQLFRQPTTDRARLLLLKCLLVTLSKEWKRLDRFRLDKYLAFVRKLLFLTIQFLGEVESSRRGGSTALDMGTEDVIAGAIGCYKDVLHEPRSVGLTMHICDILLDELIRNIQGISDDLFMMLANGIALYAMSRGDYVEKRVLDMFLGPLAAGALTSRGSVPPRREQELVRRVAHSCKDFSIAKTTVRPVRVMFAEAQGMLQQYLLQQAAPGALMRLNRKDERRQLEREIQETDQTRRSAVQELKERKMLRLRSNPKRSANAHSKEEKRRQKERKSTKRKKSYVLRKADVMGEN